MNLNNLEEKLEKKLIEETIFGKCPSCLAEAEFKYLSIQETLREPLYLYNCGNCKSTLSLGNIERKK